MVCVGSVWLFKYQPWGSDLDDVYPDVCVEGL